MRQYIYTVGVGTAEVVLRTMLRIFSFFVSAGAVLSLT